jgi:hypothetical protein
MSPVDTTSNITLTEAVKFSAVLGARVYIFFHNPVAEDLTGSNPLRKHGHSKK